MTRMQRNVAFKDETVSEKQPYFLAARLVQCTCHSLESGPWLFRLFKSRWRNDWGN